MMILIGVVVGYVLAYAPRMAAFLAGRRKPAEQKAREPTEEEKRRQEQAARDFQNFLSYTGDAQV